MNYFKAIMKQKFFSMRLYFLFLVLTFVSSCTSEEGPYLKHELHAYEKLGENCAAYDPKFSMVSNIIGERYEFQKCLPVDYKGSYQAERKGDSVVINFPKSTGTSALYKIILDINTHPRYKSLVIDGESFTIIPAGN
jgi:hypothetical protein